mgnify:CR=1 FL=1
MDDDAAPTLRIEARFKNARLYQAIQAAAVCDRPDYRRHFAMGGRVAAFCRTHGFGYDAIHNLIALRTHPLRRLNHPIPDQAPARPDYRPICYRLAGILDVPLSELFPLDLYARQWPRGVAFEVPLASFCRLREAPPEALMLPPSQEEAVHNHELRALILGAVEILSPRQANIISRRYGLHGEAETANEIAASYGTTSARIRQIEQHALRRLRQTSRIRGLS